MIIKTGCGMALAISVFLIFSSLIVADDGGDGNNFGYGNGIPPILYNPSPKNNTIDVNLSPLLSIKIYDIDGGMVDVYFYDKWDGIIGIDRVNSTKPTTASVRWDGLAMDRTYDWYIKAIDDANLTRFFPSNNTLLGFTTMMKSPPLIHFYVMDEGYWKIYNASIRCLETKDMGCTDESGYAPMTFYFDHSGKNYSFEITHNDYKSTNATVTIPDAGESTVKYVRMAPLGKWNPTPIVDQPSSGGFDIPLAWISGGGNVALAIFAIFIVAILAFIVRGLQAPIYMQMGVLMGLPVLFFITGCWSFWIMLVPMLIGTIILAIEMIKFEIANRSKASRGE